MASLSPASAIGAAISAVLLSACSSMTAVTPTATAAPCGAPSTKVADPTGVTSPGYRLGPLMLAGFSVEGAPSTTPRPIGGPTKVLIHPVERFDQPITLTGARCSDGQPLRFWYGPVHQGTPFGLGPRSTPVPEAVLAQTGDLSAEIHPAAGAATNAAGTFDYTGYMLFTTTGTWRVRAETSGHQIDEVIVQVAAVSASSSVTSAPRASPTPLTFHNSAAQAQMVATLVAFLDAFNAGRIDAAAAFLTPDVVASDCDYRASSSMSLSGIDAARRWLSERATDHDHLALDSVSNENPDPTTGSHVVAASYAKRTNDTLRALGYPNGVTPRLATKVVFTATDDHIRAFANGPGGGSSEFCRPG